jgi:hypothetical protein
MPTWWVPIRVWERAVPARCEVRVWQSRIDAEKTTRKRAGLAIGPAIAFGEVA